MAVWEYLLEPLRNLEVGKGLQASEEVDRARTGNDLNALGAEGWELVTLQPAGVEWLAVFKRLKQQLKTARRR